MRLLALLLAACTLHAASDTVRNTRYTLHLRGTSVDITTGKAARTFTPRFTILRTETNPALELRWAKFTPRDVQYNVSTWKTSTAATPSSAIATGHIADGFNPQADRPAEANRTANAFAAAPAITLDAVQANLQDNTIHFTFAPHPDFELRANLELPPDAADPLLRFTFTPKSAAWYSVAYTGAPETSPQRIDEIWQPLLWQERRFPEQAYLTEAFRCPIPGALVTMAFPHEPRAVTTSVVADPAELPFQPLPTFTNSRFGIAVRNAAGNAQATLFAPMLGGPASHMTAGTPFSFALRLIVNPGNAFDTYRYLAENLYGFHDYRSNHAVNLNRTLQNMLDYAMGPYARFDEELRAAAYDTDVPGSYKNISALHPLGIALVTDSEEIWTRRARPMLEYLLSRERFLFSTDPNVKGQGASSKLEGPAAPLSELAALYSMTQRRSPFLLAAARQLATRKRSLNLDAELDGGWWANSLALYRATGDPAQLAKARQGADAYIARRITRPQTDFNDPDSRGMFFWSSFAPQWADLYELYEATHDRRYLDAALRGAHEYSEFIWMSPTIPNADVLANEGGRAPTYRNSKSLQPILLPEERVPAWRLSEIGLTPESSGTSKGHRGIFLTSFAPWFLRLSADAHDDFLRSVARSAVVGRYTTFPGYHINTARTTVYEKPDFPLRPMSQLNSTTSIHYNHIWAQIAMVMDYLVSDVAARSHGQIDFPSQFAEGYGYVTSKVYGDRPGHFNHDQNVWLWMPKDLVDTGNLQVNYLAARGNGKLYIALTNQSKETITTTVKVLKQEFNVTLPPEGLKTLEIKAPNLTPTFQPKFLASAPAWKKDTATLALGGAHATLLNAGPDLKTVYLYLQANDLQKVTVHYTTGQTWQQRTDTSFPFEQTIPLSKEVQKFRFKLEVVRNDGTPETSPEATLEP